jgi:hypothetical protein
MVNNTIKVLLVSISLLMTGCAVTAAKQPYQHENAEEMMIYGKMQGGQLDIYINAEQVIDSSILHFDEVMKGTYKEHDVKAQCKHTKHFFSVENECDVYIDGKFAANLYLR